jgi:GAF domain-containing protein
MNTMEEGLFEAIRAADSFAEACQRTVIWLRVNWPHFDWVGIYLREGEELVLTAWDGPEATQHVRIPVGQGICGLAARTGETVIVDDVNADSRYLACFPQTRAEIVVPILKDDLVIGEIDIDSDREAAFSGEDRVFLEQVASCLAERYTDRWDQYRL